MRYLTALLFTVFFAGNALSGQCPTLVKEIDQKLQSAQLDSAAESRIKELRDQGESLHNQGKHAESVRVLREAIDELDAAS